jgi:hypothetical protein
MDGMRARAPTSVRLLLSLRFEKGVKQTSCSNERETKRQSTIDYYRISTTLSRITII